MNDALKNLATNYGLPLGVIASIVLLVLPWYMSERKDKARLIAQNAELRQAALELTDEEFASIIA